MIHGIHIESPPHAMRGDSYLKLSDPPGSSIWAIEDLLPYGATVVVAGKPKVGKTMAILEMMAVIADPAQKSWLRWTKSASGPILYIQMDQPRMTFKNKHLKNVACSPQNYSLKDLYFVDRLFTIPMPFDLATNEAAGAFVRKECERIQEQTGQWPVFVVFDSFREMYSGDEDGSGEVVKVMNTMRDAAKPAGIILIHHPTKSGAHFKLKDDFDPVQALRGSGYMGASADQVLFFLDEGFVFKGRLSDRTIVKSYMHKQSHLWVLGDKPKEGDDEGALIADLVNAHHPAMTAYAIAQMAAEDLKLDWSAPGVKDKLKKKVARVIAKMHGDGDGDSVGTEDGDPQVIHD